MKYDILPKINAIIVIQYPKNSIYTYKNFKPNSVESIYTLF